MGDEHAYGGGSERSRQRVSTSSGVVGGRGSVSVVSASAGATGGADSGESGDDASNYPYPAYEENSQIVYQGYLYKLVRNPVLLLVHSASSNIRVKF